MVTRHLGIEVDCNVIASYLNDLFDGDCPCHFVCDKVGGNANQIGTGIDLPGIFMGRN